MKIKYRMKNSERILLQFKDDERKGFRLLYDSFYDSLVLLLHSLLVRRKKLQILFKSVS